MTNSCQGPDPMPTSFSRVPGIGDSRSIIFITQTRANLPIDIYTSGNATKVVCKYGETISYGSSISINMGNTTAYGPSSTSATLTDLSPGTLYHYQVSASNDYGTDTGPDNQRFLKYGNPPIMMERGSYKNGLSVRCLKD